MFIYFILIQTKIKNEERKRNLNLGKKIIFFFLVLKKKNEGKFCKTKDFFFWK